MRTTSSLSLALPLAVLLAGAPGQNQALSSGAGVVPHAAGLVPTSEITIEAWIFLGTQTSPSNRYFQIVHKSEYDLNLGFASVTLVGAGCSHNTVAPANLGWHHVALTYDGHFLRVIFDDDMVASTPCATSTLTGSQSNLWLGGDNSPHYVPLGDMLDEVRLWSVARSPADIIFYRGVRLEQAPGLVATWHFDGDLTDSTGGHDAAPLGTVTFSSTGAPVFPMIQAPATATPGTTLTYMLQHPEPTTAYFFDVSFSGSLPGFYLPPLGLTIPLNPPWLQATYGTLVPGAFVNFLGPFDALGQARPMLNIPPVPSLSGSDIYACYVAIHPVLSTTLRVSDPVVTHLQ